MDRRTAKKLMKMNVAVARKHGDYVESHNPWETEKDMVRSLSKKGNLKSREKAHKILESGMYDRTSYKINEDKTSAIEREVAQRIRRMIKKGEIPKPNKRDKADARKHLPGTGE